MEDTTFIEDVSQEQSKRMYDQSIELLGEIYARGFDGLDMTPDVLMKLQRLQHNIMCNAMWHYEGPEEFTVEIFANRLRMATQAMFLLGVFFEQERRGSDRDID